MATALVARLKPQGQMRQAAIASEWAVREVEAAVIQAVQVVPAARAVVVGQMPQAQQVAAEAVAALDCTVPARTVLPQQLTTPSQRHVALERAETGRTTPTR
jgi:hypothetical protein